MVSKTSLTSEVISQAESYGGIRAGIICLDDVLQGPSYQVDTKGPIKPDGFDDAQIDNWKFLHEIKFQSEQNWG